VKTIFFPKIDVASSKAEGVKWIRYPCNLSPKC